MVCLTTSLLRTLPCEKRLARSSRNHSPVTTFSSLPTRGKMGPAVRPKPRLSSVNRGGSVVCKFFRNQDVMV